MIFIFLTQITFIDLPARTKASIHCFTWSSLWLALSWTRILASPLGTTGKLNPITNIFYSINLFDNSVAILASPSQTGAIGHSLWPIILNPAFFISPLKRAVFFWSCLTNSELSSSILYASIVAPTRLGAMELENKYVLALFRSISTTYPLEATNPPEAPPIAFPRVELMKSIFPSSPNNSGVPFPVFPMNPAAWHSSI